MIDPTKLNPPLEFDAADLPEGGHYYLVADFIDDDDCEKLFGYYIHVFRGGTYAVVLPESSNRTIREWSTSDLKHAHEGLVRAAVEDGVLPEKYMPH